MVGAIDRARHVKQTIVILREELRGRTIDNLVADRLDWAGYRYLLQTISEAARHIPPDWQLAHGPEIDWRQIRDLGNALRHGYHSLDAQRLWSIYEHDLDPLEAAIDRMIAAYDPSGPGRSPTP